MSTSRAGLAALLVVVAGSRAAGDDATRPAADPARGKELYRTRCASCHGASGRGDGPAARAMDPKPRDLTRGVYKLRSTPSGSLPTDDDLFRTITKGLPGTSMPAWGGLTSEERWQLVYHLKSLSPRFARRKTPSPMPAPVPPPRQDGDVERGRAVYVKMGCDKCHGPDGRGDGETARELEDDLGARIYPFDMTRGWKLKAGHAPEDVYRVLRTGLSGTPMPAYEDGVIAEADAWALVHFVRSLFVDED